MQALGSLAGLTVMDGRRARARSAPLPPTALQLAEISAELFVSVNTVRTHVKSIYRKLDVQRRSQAVERARALRLLGPSARRG